MNAQYSFSVMKIDVFVYKYVQIVESLQISI